VWLGAARQLSPLGVFTPVGENPVNKGDEARGAQHGEHAAAGVSMSPKGLRERGLGGAGAVLKGTNSGERRREVLVPPRLPGAQKPLF
jgi:hypothetical protein